jgi:hypothetical protein
VVAAQAVAADVLCGIGANDAALAMADRARAAAADVGGAAADWANVQLDSAKCGAFISLGLLDDAEALAATGYRDAIGADRPVAQALFGGWSGIVLAQRGLVRSGLGRLRDATAALPPGAFSFLPVLHAQTAQAAALLGDLDTAGAALIQAEHALTGAGEACAPWVRLAAANDTQASLTSQITYVDCRSTGHGLKAYNFTNVGPRFSLPNSSWITTALATATISLDQLSGVHFLNTSAVTVTS